LRGSERRLGLLDDLAELRRIGSRKIRSSSISAAFRPAMNWLYESPFARAPALMRMIQSFRNSRFRTLRSRYAYARERSTCSLAYV
jgi:hypothetical protein